MSVSTRTLETLEIVGGAVCLDFVNTVNSRHALEHDYLQSYPDLLAWAVKAGIIPLSQHDRLLRLKRKDADGADAALQKALRIRELLYSIFSAAAGKSKPEAKDLEEFVKQYAKAIARSSLVRTGDHFAFDWKTAEHFNTVLWPVLFSAGQILFSLDLSKVKECPNCGWLFLDTSKNQSRRWCSMNTCGARDKMRRYHSRRRTE